MITRTFWNSTHAFLFGHWKVNPTPLKPARSVKRGR